MTLKRVLTSLASLLLVLYAQAADIVTVTGEFTYYGSKTESRADCEARGTERAVPRRSPKSSARS